MSLREHKIELSLLREGEKVLHNCTSHWFIHMKLPLLFLISILLPFIALFFMMSADVISDSSTLNLSWFLYSSYGLLMASYFFVRAVNSQLSGCVITNQRMLRFGYKGLYQMVERDILPNKIEDVKIVKKGMSSVLFDMADVRIHTANNEIETLRNVIDSRKIQEAFANMIRNYRPPAADKQEVSEKKPITEGWIDDALGETKGELFDFDSEEHRKEFIGKIGDVFRKKDEEE